MKRISALLLFALGATLISACFPQVEFIPAPKAQEFQVIGAEAPVTYVAPTSKIEVEMTVMAMTPGIIDPSPVTATVGPTITMEPTQVGFQPAVSVTPGPTLTAMPQGMRILAQGQAGGATAQAVTTVTVMPTNPSQVWVDCEVTNSAGQVVHIFVKGWENCVGLPYASYFDDPDGRTVFVVNQMINQIDKVTTRAEMNGKVIWVKWAVLDADLQAKLDACGASTIGWCKITPPDVNMPKFSLYLPRVIDWDRQRRVIDALNVMINNLVRVLTASDLDTAYVSVIPFGSCTVLSDAGSDCEALIYVTQPQMAQQVYDLLNDPSVASQIVPAEFPALGIDEAELIIVPKGRGSIGVPLQLKYRYGETLLPIVAPGGWDP